MWTPCTQQAWDPLPPIIMRKYIAYARKYCHPILDDGAKQVIQDFYLQLRKRKNFMDSTPVTTRQLEALIRLAVCTSAEGLDTDLKGEAMPLYPGQTQTSTNSARADVRSCVWSDGFPSLLACWA